MNPETVVIEPKSDAEVPYSVESRIRLLTAMTTLFRRLTSTGGDQPVDQDEDIAPWPTEDHRPENVVRLELYDYVGARASLGVTGVLRLVYPVRRIFYAGKVLRGDPTHIREERRFIDQLVMGPKHKQLIKPHCTLEFEGRTYVVMEYMDRGSLWDMVTYAIHRAKRSGVWTIGASALAGVFFQIAVGVRASNGGSGGWIGAQGRPAQPPSCLKPNLTGQMKAPSHRGVNPWSVLVRSDGATKLCDFGGGKTLQGHSLSAELSGNVASVCPVARPSVARNLSKGMRMKLSRNPQILYLAPEVFDQSPESVTQAADIWSMAIVMAQVAIGGLFPDNCPYKTPQNDHYGSLLVDTDDIVALEGEVSVTRPVAAPIETIGDWIYRFAQELIDRIPKEMPGSFAGLLRRMTVRNPRERPTIEQVLTSEFFRVYLRSWGFEWDEPGPWHPPRRPWIPGQISAEEQAERKMTQAQRDAARAVPSVESSQRFFTQRRIEHFIEAAAADSREAFSGWIGMVMKWYKEQIR